LACSGCITSAETVLITQQSHEELYRIIEFNQVINHLMNFIQNFYYRFFSFKQKNANNVKIIAISLSLQSIASIAAKYELQMQTAAEKIASFFHKLGVHYIFDISLARHFSLIETQKEFMDRFNKNELPVLSSVCPGFVCYAEKSNGELLVPLLSQVKSPQQIMGQLIKRFMKQNQINEIYHISIMPCYDKKLEATRNHNEFCDLSDDNFKEVDCVLTPIEIEVILNRENVVLSDLENRKLDSIIPEYNEGLLKSHLGSGSGGYVENLFRFMASKYFSNYYEIGQQLNYKVLRNKDFIELTLEDQNGHKLLSFAITNGFRNIQTLVQRIKRKTCHYQYVEVMACPAGCLNGGAQLRADSIEDKLFDRVENLYKSLDITSLPVNCEDETVEQLYEKCFLKDNTSKLYTKFSPVPKNLNLINVNW
jgi:iron only hydrogenase large subunit-like protein